MKNILFILVMFFGINSAFAQYDYSEIIGTYEGHLYDLQQGKDVSTNWKIIIFDDYTISLNAKIDGIWIEHFREKSTLSTIKIADDKSVYFPLILSENSEFSSLIVSIPSDKFKSNTKFEGLNIALFSTNEDVAYFDMNRIGGNPTLKSTKVVENYKGSTTAWGNYTIRYEVDNNIGMIDYDKVLNNFYYVKSGNDYVLKSKLGETDFVVLKYIYDEAGKTFKLATRPTLNVNLYDEAALFRQLYSSQYISEEKRIHSIIGDLFFELIKAELKQVKSNDNVLFLLNGSAYVGEIKNKSFHGKGTLFYDGEIHVGSFVDGERHGNFDLTLKEGKGKARFEHNKKTGVWKLTRPNGDIQEITFDNDEKVSSRIIENPKSKVKHNLGISVNQTNDKDELYVTSVDENSAIYKAGMRMGDSFYRINGENVVKMNRLDAENKLTYTTTDFFELEFFAKVWDKQMIVRVFPKTNTFKKVKRTANNHILRGSTIKKEAEKSFSDYVAIDEKIANVMTSSNFDNMTLATLKSNIDVINKALETLQQKQSELQAELMEIHKKASAEKCKWLTNYAEQAMKNNQEAVQSLNAAYLNFMHAATFSTKDEIRNFMFGASDAFANAKGEILNFKKAVTNANFASCN